MVRGRDNILKHSQKRTHHVGEKGMRGGKDMETKQASAGGTQLDYKRPHVRNSFIVSEGKIDGFL